MSEIEGSNKRRKMNSGESVNLERFYPTMELRVLLVEADDSTRQIVSALLRKCNYKVSAVADGLKAWELIKANPHNIDLILTEVDLPSISGFALLTLIMEHEICKTIPVIMMSSQDSSSTAYKCMLRGAADYFFKPIRRNELRNLWQHAWRRQSSIIGGNTPRDEIVGQKKVEASENNNASNRSRGCLACVERNKEQNEKGSDTQSSCTKPDTENMMEFSCVPSNSLKHEVQANSVAKLLLVEAGGDALIDSPREAIDFMGTFDRNYDSSWINSTNEFDSSTRLDLSLSRCYCNASENHATEERPTLWNPNSSAFTRYSSRPSQPLHSTLTSMSDPKQESGTSHEKMLSDSEYNFDTPSPMLTSQTNTNSSGQLYDQLTSNSNHLIDNPVLKADQKLDSTEDRGHISPTLDQSPSSSLCNGSLSQLNGIAYGSSSASNGDIEEVDAVRASTESKNNDVFPSLGGNSHRSTQREAALTKFRLKRKDRSFEKKVRYESRKKLAEQRPRVKGQFVRQVPVDPSHVIIVT